ncbi:MAG TPA: hypothetical protein VFU88_17680, partial [Ktedonobacterales bacterium]|nr:hypothetical protein [Ktedonobacterales bacterium]
QHVRIGGQTVLPSLTLFVLVGAGDLPPELASSAQAAVSAALDGMKLHTTVPRGDYFATKEDAKGVPVARRASSTMSADLNFFVTPPDSTMAGAALCALDGFCPAPLDSPPPYSQQTTQVPDNVWNVSVTVSMRWTFRPPGQAPLVAAPVAFGGGPSVWLAYDGTGGWQVTVSSFGDGTGQTLGDQLRQGICWAGATLLGNVGGPGQHQFGMGTGGDGGKDQGVDGCVIQLFLNDGSSPSSPSGNVIWRFGALLAADAGAQKLLPMLPAAPDDEVKAVTR